MVSGVRIVGLYPDPLAELGLRGSGRVPDFSVPQFNVAPNLSFSLSFLFKKSHFLGTNFFPSLSFILIKPYLCPSLVRRRRRRINYRVLRMQNPGSTGGSSYLGVVRHKPAAKP